MNDLICTAKLNNGTINGISLIKKNHLISVCTSLENSLTDRKRKYVDKVHALVSAWEQIINFVSETSAESPQPFFEVLFISTLRFVLRADWKNTIDAATKTHLGVTLQRFITILRKNEAHHSILEQSRVLESLVKDPWGQPALCKILNSQDGDLNDSLEYFRLENGTVVSVRLEMLLESKCEDLAINLCKACINTINHFNEDLEGFDTLDFNQDEIDYILDIYFSCLSKKKRTQEIIDEIKKYQLDDGLRLLQRYRQHTVGGKFKERCKAARVWKCHDKIVHLLSETLLAKAVLHGDSSESQSLLEDLIVEWAAIRTVDGVLPTVALEGIRKFVLIAPSSETIYPFCSLLIRNGNCKEQYFDMVARCLIRAIIQNINEVEQLRVNKEREKLKEMYYQLSKGFLLLSDLLTECRNIYKECLLTSFSLTPTRECLQTIEAFVTQLAQIADPPEELTAKPNLSNQPVPSIDSSSPEVENRSSDEGTTTTIESALNQPENSSIQCKDIVLGSQSSRVNSRTSNSTKAGAGCETLLDTSSSNSESVPIMSSSVTKKDDTSELNKIMTVSETNANNQMHEELDSVQVSKQVDSELKNLKLDEDMDEDLNIILNYKRSHTLTWDLSWPELKANCEKYLENFEKKDFDDVELKYLDLDYNLYKDKPINYDDTYGIEKGYEHYAYSPSDSEEEVSSTKKSGLSSIDSDEDVLLIYRKRKKAISSDSDESKSKKKRGRKVRFKAEESKRRNSQKSDTGSNTEDDKVHHTIESVIAGSSNAQNLKELRSFRITSMKSVNSGESFIDDNHNESVVNEETTKKYEELHNILEDSYKSLESVEFPPIWPKFNVYDVILDNTLVPLESEKRLPKCEDLLYNNENFYRKNIAAFELEKRKKKLHKSAIKEKNPNHRKTPSKVPKMKVFPSTNSYLAYTANQQSSRSTLLSNDEEFKSTCDSKQKSDEKLLENQNENKTNMSPVIQLPKLSETFNKKSFAMKSIDQNVSFSSYLTESSIDNSSNSRPFYSTLSRNTLSNNSFPPNSSNAVNNGSSDENIEDIENFIKSFPDCTSTQPTNTVQVAQQLTTVDSTCQTDFNPSDVDYLHGVLDSASSNFTNSPCTSESSISASVPKSVHESMPITSTSISIPSSVINEPAGAVFSCNSGIRSNNISLNKTETGKVDQLLQNYQTMITAYPELKNVPAPRKRNNSNNVPRKPRSRAKKDSQTTKKPHGRLDDVETNSADCKPLPVAELASSNIPNGNAVVSANSYLANNSDLLYDTSPEKLPIINDASQIIQVPGERLPYQGNVAPTTDTKPIFNQYPRVEVRRINPLLHMYPVSSNTKVNGVNKFVPPAKPNVLKTLLTQGHTANRHYGSSVSAEIEHQSPPLSRENQLNTNSTNKYYNTNTPQDSAVSQSVRTSQLTNGQQFSSPTTNFSQFSQQPNTTQNLKGYGGLTKNFEVRLARIDSKIDVKNYSANNSQFSYPTNTSNKTNFPPVSSNLLPQVVLPIISIPDAMLHTSDNYQTTNNFNSTSTSAASLTEVKQNTQENVDNYQVMNDATMTTAVAPNNSIISMSNQFSHGLLTNTPNDDKNESNAMWYGTINTESPDFNTISIPEESYFGDLDYLNNFL